MKLDKFVLAQTMAFSIYGSGQLRREPVKGDWKPALNRFAILFEDHL